MAKKIDIAKVLGVANEKIEALEAENARLQDENAGLLELTELLDEHPEDYEGSCLCKLCKSYG